MLHTADSSSRHMISDLRLTCIIFTLPMYYSEKAYLLQLTVPTVLAAAPEKVAAGWLTAAESGDRIAVSSLRGYSSDARNNCPTQIAADSVLHRGVPADAAFPYGLLCCHFVRFL